MPPSGPKPRAERERRAARRGARHSRDPLMGTSKLLPSGEGAIRPKPRAERGARRAARRAPRHGPPSSASNYRDAGAEDWDIAEDCRRWPKLRWRWPSNASNAMALMWLWPNSSNCRWRAPARGKYERRAVNRQMTARHASRRAEEYRTARFEAPKRIQRCTSQCRRIAADAFERAETCAVTRVEPRENIERHA